MSTNKYLNVDCLKFGLRHSYINKNKFVKKDLAVKLESLAEKVDEFAELERKELFHEYLRKTTNELARNVQFARDDTFKASKVLKDNPNIVILSEDKCYHYGKDSIPTKTSNNDRWGIEQGKYVHSEDTIIKDLESLNDIVTSKITQNTNWWPSNNQRARFFATAKTHKFDHLEDINLADLKLRPIIDQTGSCYSAGKVIASYLSTLADNEFIIKDTQKFPESLESLPPLQPDEERCQLWCRITVHKCTSWGNYWLHLPKDIRR